MKLEMTKRGAVLSIILALICIAIIIGYKMWNKPFPGLSRNAYKVTATQLFKDFSEDEQKAQQKYVPEKLDNKTQEVTGEIKDTGENADGEKYYLLNTGNEIFGVKCIFNKGDLILKANPGNTVSILGFCTGYNMDVILNRCQQIK